MKKLLMGLTILAYMFFASGCSTLADAKAAKGTGTSAIYNQEFDVVWDAILNIIESSNLDLVSSSKEDGSILAQKGMSAFSYGENVAIFVEVVGDEVKTRVEVVNKRALATNITATNWERKIINSLNEKLSPDLAN